MFGKNIRNEKTANEKSNQGKEQKIRLIFLVIVFIIVSIFFSIFAKGFLSLNTFLNILRQNTALTIVSLGVTFVIMLGGTDLSTGSNIALAGICGAIAMNAIQGSTVGAAIVGFVVTAMAGAALGALNGLLIGRFNISAFMVTLATQSLARGLAIFLSASKRIVVKNSIFLWIGNADLINIGKISVPASILFLAVIFLILQFVMNSTTFGRKTIAVGGNKVAAAASGIRVNLHTFLCYTLCGLCTGLASIVIIGRATSAQPTAGTNVEFDAITAVVMGGTSLVGGAGSLVGSVIGTFLIGLIFSGLGMMPISSNFTYIAKGILIIVAVYIDVVVNKRHQRIKPVEENDSHTELAVKSLVQIRKENPQTLDLIDITKIFPGVVALDKVNLHIKRGSVHALMGENGAGKSTLMKVLSGVYKKDGGYIQVDGQNVEIRSPMDSQKLGISVIYQELALVPELTIAQNIFLGKEIRRFGIQNHREMKRRAQQIIDRFGLNLNVNKRVCDCTVGQQQMVEIAKAVMSDSWIIVMDEPTSAISENEKDKLFEIIRELKQQDIAVVYISHRMAEIFDICDEITVLRDGKFIMNGNVRELGEEQIITSMVGREVTDVFNRKKSAPGETVLEVRNLYRKGVFEPISFNVRRGEVLGFSGLMGAGRTEIARCLFGLDKPDGGEIYLFGKKVEINSVSDAVRNGIAYVSEDRRREGIIPLMPIRENVTLPALRTISRAGKIDFELERSIVNDYINRLSVKCSSMEQAISKLSGGNQQKVCLAKWLSQDPVLLILDEPTRGIDIGAKADIHKIIEKLCQQGLAVIMISSELPEILGSSDRVVVLYEGKMTGTFDSMEGVTQGDIMTYAAQDKAGQ